MKPKNADKDEGGNPSIGVKAETSQKSKSNFSALFADAEWVDYVLMLIGVLGGCITGVSMPYFNLLFGQMLDALNDDPDNFQGEIHYIAYQFIGVAIFNLFSGVAQVGCWSIAGERQAQRLRAKYVNSILRQEIGWFDTCGAGTLATKVEDLSGLIQDGIGRKIGDFIQYLTQFIASFCVGFYLCWRLTAVLISAIPCIGLAGAYMIAATTSYTTQSSEQYAKAGGVATEALNSIRTITALNAQPDVIGRYRIFLIEAMNAGIFKGFKVGFANGGLFFVCFLTYALGFWYGGKLVADDIDNNCTHDCKTGGTILSTFFCVLMGSIALGQMAPSVVALSSAASAVASMEEVTKRQPLIDGFSNAGEKPATRPAGKIELVDVDFAYPSRPDIMVCDAYNLTIEPGETVALCGASGAGKSTIVNLLLRFYDPQNGRILLDGRDIRQLNIRWLRSQIGYVGQEPVLFSGTIFENIACGIDEESTNQSSKQAIRERIYAACSLANAHDFISAFPKGYDTDVGSNGVALSGGQKQRIAIARAIVKRPAVLLLDEATSALDTVSEKLVQASIDQLQQSKMQTTVVIAHRLSTIRNADKIAVVAEGRVAELGTHNDLIALNGRYADLVNLQMMGNDDDGAVEEIKEDGAGHEGVVQEVSGTPVTTERKVSIANEDKGNKKESKVEDGKKKKKKDEKLDISKAEQKVVNGKIWGLIFSQPTYLLLGLLGAATFGAVFPVWGLLLAHVNAMFYSSADHIREQASVLSSYFVIMAAICLVSCTAQYGFIGRIGERISLKLRSDMFEAVIRREISFFDKEENSTGSLTARLSNDSRIVAKATGEAVAKQVQAIFTLLIGLGLALSASWKIALVVLATFPATILASAIQMQAIAGQQGNLDDNDEDEETKGGPAGALSSALTHMRTVSAFSLQTKVGQDYSEATAAVSAGRQIRSIPAGFGFGSAQMCMFLTYALLFWYGSTLIESGEIEFVDMMTAILCLMLGALGLGMAFTDIGDQKAGLQAAARILRAVEQSRAGPIDGLSGKGTVPSSHAKGKIELKGVEFFYPTRPDTKVCKNYSLTIEPGQVVALVGPSGSGKSTIMNLLLRFYDPIAGGVYLDDIDVKELNVRWLRSQIGYVGQEPVLFQGSVADNIARGRATKANASLMTLEEALQSFRSNRTGLSAYLPLPTVVVDEEAPAGEVDEDIRRAAISSNADEFITHFTKGYQTDVGEGSMMVSGGQKQRIAIARALVKNPAVLLLDEATSALDSASEKIVQESIDQLQQNHAQTTIVIAHRLSTIKNADKIVVIDKGAVVETGTHDELLAKEGLYAELWSKQKGTSKSTRSTMSVKKLNESLKI